MNNNASWRSAKMIFSIFFLLSNSSRFPVDYRVRIGARTFVFFPNFYALVGLACYESRARHVECARHHRTFTFKRPGLRFGARFLKAISAFPIPKSQRTVVRRRHKHILMVHAKSMQNGGVPRHIVAETSGGKPPFFYVIGCAAHKRKLCGMLRERPHALFVICERHRSGTFANVPKTDRAVHGSRDNLGVRTLS